jgi:dGTP triphosphohydrolase
MMINITYYTSALQHGRFRKFRSCETQIIEFIDDVTQNVHDGKQTDVIIMDFSKALGEVIHNLLIHKLKHNNIRGKINNWIERFLLDRTRTQTVIILRVKNLHTSLNIDSEAPHGSLLGARLYLYYTNFMYSLWFDPTVRARTYYDLP